MFVGQSASRSSPAEPASAQLQVHDMSLLTQLKATRGARWVIRPAWRWARRTIALAADRAQDVKRGIDTSAPGGSLQSVFTDDTGYEPLPYRSIRRVHGRLAVSANDVLFDVGCGKGRIFCYFAQTPIRRCVGIERVPLYVAAARDNARRLRRSAPIEVRQENAAETDYTEATIILIFNPFGPGTMARVREQVYRSVEAAPRRVRIVYVNALFDQVWAEAGWLRRTQCFTLPYKGRWKMNVSVWDSDTIHAQI